VSAGVEKVGLSNRERDELICRRYAEGNTNCEQLGLKFSISGQRVREILVRARRRSVADDTCATERAKLKHGEPLSNIAISALLPAGYKLSVRAANVLYNLGIKTLSQLLDYGAVDLLLVPNCGEKTLKEIEEALANIGLKLAKVSRWQRNRDRDRSTPRTDWDDLPNARGTPT
jgi:hypothetical protein